MEGRTYYAPENNALPAAGAAAVSVDDDRTFLPVFAAPAEGEPAESVVLTVLEQHEGEAATTVKTYTISDLKDLAESKVVGYQHWKNGSEKIIASDLYTTVDSLLADAGVSFGSGDAVTAADPTDFTSTLTYEDSNIYKY